MLRRQNRDSKVLIATIDRSLSNKVCRILSEYDIPYRIINPLLGLGFCHVKEYTHVVYGNSRPLSGDSRPVPDEIKSLKLPVLYCGEYMNSYLRDLQEGESESDSSTGIYTDFERTTHESGRLVHFKADLVTGILFIDHITFEPVFKEFVGEDSTGGLQRVHR
uniref:Uncharacterized protein n=1 Tax=viral metagenome TaxID=1070528 RepID=A0A6C0JXW6_9ZZZZ